VQTFDFICQLLLLINCT